jgi:hypothetical protein
LFSKQNNVGKIKKRALMPFMFCDITLHKIRKYFVKHDSKVDYKTIKLWVEEQWQ